MALIRKLFDKSKKDPLESFQDFSGIDGQDLLGYRISGVKEEKKEPNSIEEIYALEEVDPRTIKKLDTNRAFGDSLKEEPREVERFQEEILEKELNLGLTPEGQVESLRLREPIQILGLSEAAEKKLLENNKKILKDLLNLSQQKCSLGQGHVDEIQESLKKYLSGSSLTFSKSIDYKSIVHSCFGDIPPLSAYLLLKPYHLETIYTLTPSSRANLERQSETELKELYQKAKLTIEAKKPYVRSLWDELISAFVVPWVRSHLGIASKKEVLESLIALGPNEEFATYVIRMLEDLFLDKEESSFKLLKVASEEGIFCLNTENVSLYDMVIQRSKSYFYRPKVSYSLEELSSLLYREFARSWHHFPDGFIERALKISPSYRVRKAEKSVLYVRMR